MNQVIDFIQVNRERYLEELKALLAIPSISALPQHAGDVRACARRVVRRKRWDGIGLAERAPHRDAGQQPIVYGDWLGAPGAPRRSLSTDTTTTAAGGSGSTCGTRRRSRRRFATAQILTPAGAADDKG